MLGGAAKAKSKGILIWQSGDEVVAVNYMWSGDRRHSPTPFGRQPLGGGRSLALWACFGALGGFFWGQTIAATGHPLSCGWPRVELASVISGIRA